MSLESAVGARLIRTSFVAEKTLSLELELSDPNYRFEAGQAASLSFVDPARSGESRTFSFSSAPAELPRVTFATRLTPGSSFKEALAQARPNDSFEISSPFGEFLLPQGDEAAKPLVLLAGGIGITPFRSMIRQVKRSGREGHMTLLTLNRTQEETPFYEECQSWKEEGVVSWVPVETRAPGVSGIPRETLVTSALEGIFKEAGEEARLYLAGPPAMVDGLARILETAFRFPQERLTMDLFFGYPSA
ncbi:MAG: FAD-dependent oxidoreductase [Leptospirales bacterium]